MRKVKVTISNIDGHTEECLYFGDCPNEDRLIYRDDTKFVNIIDFHDDEFVEIKRINTGFKSCIRLQKDHGHVKIKTDEGEIELPIFVTSMFKDENCLEIHYKVEEKFIFKMEFIKE